jgi:hypothetical protein
MKLEIHEEAQPTSDIELFCCAYNFFDAAIELIEAAETSSEDNIED